MGTSLTVLNPGDGVVAAGGVREVGSGAVVVGWKKTIIRISKKAEKRGVLDIYFLCLFT